MRLHVFGDSHSAFCFDRFRDTQIHWLGPRTMHGFSRDAPVIINRRVDYATENDIFLFIFGEIDIRCHIIRISNESGKHVPEITKVLVERYVHSVYETMLSYPDCRAILAQPPFPSDRRPNPAFPFIGTLEQRIAAHTIMGCHLQTEANRYGFLYLPFPQAYKTRDGGLIRKYSDDGVHIMPSEAREIVKSIETLTNAKIAFDMPWSEIVLRRIDYFLGRKLSRRGGLQRVYKQLSDNSGEYETSIAP